jgi:hypothetical protein
MCFCAAMAKRGNIARIVSTGGSAPDGHTWHTLTAKNGEGLRIRPPTGGHQHTPVSALQRRLGDEHCPARGDRWQSGRP